MTNLSYESNLSFEAHFGQVNICHGFSVQIISKAQPRGLYIPAKSAGLCHFAVPNRYIP